jgi:hypothetical protein
MEMRWVYLGAGTDILQKNKRLATAEIRTPNRPVCSQVTKQTDRMSTRRGNYIVPSYMAGGTDGQTWTDGYVFISQIYKSKKRTKLRILSFDLSYMEDLEVKRAVILKCNLKNVVGRRGQFSGGSCPLCGHKYIMQSNTTKYLLLCGVSDK